MILGSCFKQVLWNEIKIFIFFFYFWSSETFWMNSHIMILGMDHHRTVDHHQGVNMVDHHPEIDMMDHRQERRVVKD